MRTNFTPETIKQIFETTVFTGTAIRQILEQATDWQLQDFVREYGNQIEGWIMPAKVTFPRKTKPLPEIVSRFVSQDDSRKALMGIIHNYKDRLLIATDGKQMTYCAMPEDEKPSEANARGMSAVYLDGIERLDLNPPNCRAIYNQKFSRPVTIGKLDVMAGYIKARNNLSRIKKNWYFRQNVYFNVKICGLDFSSLYMLDFLTAFMDAGDEEITMEFSGEPGEIAPVRFTGKSGLTVIIMPLFPGRDNSKPDRPLLPASGFDILAYAEKYQSGTFWKDYRKIPAYGLEITGIDGEHGNPFLLPEQTGKIDVTADYAQMKNAREKFSKLGGIMFYRAVGAVDFDEKTEKDLSKLKIRIGIATGPTAELFRKFNRIIPRLKSREDCIANMPEMWSLIATYDENVSRLNAAYKEQGKYLSLSGFEQVSKEIIRNKIISAIETGKITLEEAEKIALPGIEVKAQVTAQVTADNAGSKEKQDAEIVPDHAVAPETSAETADNGERSGNTGNHAGQRTIAPEMPGKQKQGRRTRGRIGWIIRRTIPERHYSIRGSSFGREHAYRITGTGKQVFTGTRTCGLAITRTCLPPRVCGHGKTCGPPYTDGHGETCGPNERKLRQN